MEVRLDLYASVDGLFEVWDANVFLGRGETSRWVGSAASALHPFDVYTEALIMARAAYAEEQLNDA